MKAFIIRNLRKGDFKGVVNTYFSYYEELKENPGIGLSLYRKRPTIAQERKWFASLLENIRKKNAIVIVAQMDGKVVGMCDVLSFRPGSSMDHKGLLGIAIHKDYRSHGIGSAMLKEVLRQSRRRFETIVLSAFSNNRGAVALYKRFGFKQYGFLRRSNKRGGKYFDESFFYLNLK